MRFRQILVPIDFSRHSAKALDCAIDLAKQSEGRIHILHAYAIQPTVFAPYGMVLDPALVTECREAATRETERWAEKPRAAGIEVETTVTPLLPSEAIVTTAGEIGADLIVMGSRGLTGLKHVLLGSVADRTLRTAPCPVLTLKDDEAD